MTQNATPPWGPMCVCADPQLVHRGAAHRGPCASARCNYLVAASRCQSFREKTPVASDLVDADTPHARVRGDA